MLIQLTETLSDHLIRYYHDFRSTNRFNDIKLFHLDGNNIIVPKNEEYKYNPIEGNVPKIKVEIIALCSTIHVPTNATLIYARDTLRKLSQGKINIQIKYYKNSGQIFSDLRGYNNQSIPVITTFSEGSSLKANRSYNLYKCKRAIECIPGYLRFTNPSNSSEHFNVNDISSLKDISFFHYDHPSDEIATNQFIKFLKKNNMNSHDLIDNIMSDQINTYKEMPEIPDQYRTLKKNELSLTVEFLDTIQTKSNFRPLFDWKQKEPRYLHFNNSLNDLKYTSRYAIRNNDSDFAKWLQRYLINIMRKIAQKDMHYWSSIQYDDEFNTSLKSYFK